MAKQYSELSPELIDFIGNQHVFFVATAAADGRVNLSPKGQDCLKVMGPNDVLWFNLTGSGNETAAHLREVNRMTIMWTAFTGPPMILRVYGRVQTVHPRDADWQPCVAALPAQLGARQYFKLHIDLVQTSCGFAVPLMEYQADRKILANWAETQGQDNIEKYWRERNGQSIDGLPTGIVEDA